MANSKKQSPSTIWKRTVYYFLVVLVLFSAGITYFVLSVSSDRVQKNLLRETSLRLAQERITFLKSLSQKLPPSSSKTKEAAALTQEIEQRLLLAEEIKNSAQKLQELERRPKDSQNSKAIVQGIQKHYAFLESKWRLTNIYEEFRKLHWKFIAVFTLFFIGISGMMALLMRMILLPLEHIVRAAVEIAKGNLQTPIRVDTNDELSQLATVLRDLSNNTRELLFLIANTHKDGHSHIAKLEEALQSGKQELIKEHIEEIRELHNRLKEVTDYFEYRN